MQLLIKKYSDACFKVCWWASHENVFLTEVGSVHFSKSFCHRHEGWTSDIVKLVSRWWVPICMPSISTVQLLIIRLGMFVLGLETTVSSCKLCSCTSGWYSVPLNICWEWISYLGCVFSSSDLWYNFIVCIWSVYDFCVCFYSVPALMPCLSSDRMKKMKCSFI